MNSDQIAKRVYNLAEHAILVHSRELSLLLIKTSLGFIVFNFVFTAISNEHVWLKVGCAISVLIINGRYLWQIFARLCLPCRCGTEPKRDSEDMYRILQLAGYIGTSLILGFYLLGIVQHCTGLSAADFDLAFFLLVIASMILGLFAFQRKP